jgi:hypothetical protein
MQRRRRVVSIIALLMILFGLAEVVTGISHSFLRIADVDQWNAEFGMRASRAQLKRRSLGRIAPG